MARATLLLAFLLVAGIALIYRWRRRVALRRAAEALRARNRELSDFVIARLDEVGALLDRNDISPVELTFLTEAVYAMMESRNPDGALDPLIADSRAYVQEQVEKRSKG